jgi:Uma2 family endonuclease
MKGMSDPAKRIDETFTYGDYRLWPEEERWELIEGVPYSMSPGPMRRHQELSKRLFWRICAFLEGKPCTAYDAPFDVLLPAGNEDDDEVLTVVQPDIVVYCDLSKLMPKGARGAPDWVIEVLSPYTSKKDFGIKSDLFEKHGVREYWIVDPASLAIHVWRLGEGGRFGKEALYEAGEGDPTLVIPSIFEGLSFDMHALFVNLD